MFREKDISEFMPQVRYQGGQSVNLQAVQAVLSECAGRYGIPVAFKDDQIKFGGGSNSGAVEDVFRSTVGFAKTTGSLAKAAIGGLRSLGGGKDKLQEEKNWYAMIYDIFNEMRV